jgi:protocatechuate 3,4-dioxygenase alpha subunit
MLHPTPTLRESPSQTAGPYVHIGMVPNFSEITGVYDRDLGAKMLAPDTPGTRIEITGRILDGTGAPLGDALVEVWQADAQGRYGAEGTPVADAPGFTGWGRQATDNEGYFTFRTIKPGRVSGPDGKPMAPHLSLWIVARGINIGLQTRLYFSDEAEANEADWVLNRIMDKRRRATLLATRDGEGSGGARYRFDIHLQGEHETVFFDF